MKRLLLTLLVALIPATGWGQASVLQGGSWTPGLAPVYSSSGGSQPVVQQSGTAGGGQYGTGLKELNITARGNNCNTAQAPVVCVAQGAGQLGTVFQIQDAATVNSGGYHALSFSANVNSGGLIAYNGYNGASALPLRMNINGTTYEFPFALSGVVGPPVSVVNDMACWDNVSGTLLKDCGAPILGPGSAVNNNAVCWNGTTGKLLKDCGITPGTVNGPGSAVVGNIVTWANTAATLVADSGLKPQLDVRTYGAVCDGVTDTAAAFALANTAAVALGGATVNVPANCGIGSTVSISAKVYFRGTGQGVISVKTLSANVTPFQIAVDNAGVLDMTIDMTVGVNASGCGVNIAAGSYALVANLKILGPFNGICSSGSVATIMNVIVLSPTTSTGSCYHIGASINTYVINSFCRGASSGSQPLTTVLVNGAGGGHVFYNLQGIYSGSGITVTANAVSIEWIFSVNTVMDTGTGHGFLLTAGAGGVIKGFFSTGDWASSFTQNGVVTSTSGGGIIDDVRFNGLRAYTNQQNGVAFLSGDNLSINSSSICGNSASPSVSGTYHGVTSSTTATNIKVTASTIGNCAQQASTQGYGIASSAPIVQYQSNTLTGNATGPLSIVTAPTSAVIKDNIGIDDVIPTVASGATIAVPVNPIVAISGTTTITNLGTTWPNRTVMFTPTGTGFYIGGAAQCGSGRNVYVYNGRAVQATYLGTGFSCWMINTNDQQSPPSMTYAARPTVGLSVGMTITFTDSSTATWGANIAGGGANVVLGQWNGTNWTVVGI